MIKKYFHKGKSFDFINQDSFKEGTNVFTILIGKNGTGKSSLLGEITRNLLNNIDSKYFLNDEEHFYSKGNFQFSQKPRRIICVSTSPFDKFPVKRSLEEVEDYAYLGLRGLYSTNFGLSYLSRIISSLIESISRDPNQANGIANVLNYLGYKRKIKVVFKISSSRLQIEQFMRMESIDDLFSSRINNSIRFLNKRFFVDDFEELDYDKFNYLRYLATRILNYDLRKNYELIISNKGIESDYDFDTTLNKELLFLIQSGLLKLKDVSLTSKKNNSTFSITKASSGEQSLILSILGIASQINDNSLICIDEPEICLHPQWQERYIQLLIKTFDTYHNCQFLIATHSPQIIANLRDRNCYILTMENGKLLDAAYFINNSSDFQLATLFETPGFKNEYLSRIALNIFSKVSRNKTFDKDDKENYNILERQSSYLDKNDPVYDIFISLKEMKDEYGRS